MGSIDKVREFHKAFGVECPEKPTPSTADIRVLRVKLIAEELCELCEALGVGMAVQVGLSSEPIFNAWVRHSRVDLVETADALADLDYVVQGSNLAFGIPAAAVMDEVHRSNMSKLGADGKPVLLPSGKITKGPNYRKPDIARVLKEHAK